MHGVADVETRLDNHIHLHTFFECLNQLFKLLFCNELGEVDKKKKKCVCVSKMEKMCLCVL